MGGASASSSATRAANVLTGGAGSRGPRPRLRSGTRAQLRTGNRALRAGAWTMPASHPECGGARAPACGHPARLVDQGPQEALGIAPAVHAADRLVGARAGERGAAWTRGLRVVRCGEVSRRSVGTGTRLPSRRAGGGRVSGVAAVGHLWPLAGRRNDVGREPRAAHCTADGARAPCWRRQVIRLSAALTGCVSAAAMRGGLLRVACEGWVTMCEVGVEGLARKVRMTVSCAVRLTARSR